MKHMDFSKIYENHAEQIYKFLMRLCGDRQLAEDLLQDTFLKAMEKIDTFDNRCQLTTWLCQIAKNTYYDNLRKKQRHVHTYLSEELVSNEGILLEDEILKKESVREIRMLIHQLPEPYKEVFLLRFYAELSFQEIGQMFDKSEVWGRVTYLRSKAMLINMMENLN